MKRATSGETKEALISFGDLPCREFVAHHTGVCNDLTQPQLQVNLALQGTRTVSQVDKAGRKSVALQVGGTCATTCLT